eukprot:scaffold4656_cov117-Isochrysis_galbana.AAC.18
MASGADAANPPPDSSPAADRPAPPPTGHKRRPIPGRLQPRRRQHEMARGESCCRISWGYTRGDETTSRSMDLDLKPSTWGVGFQIHGIYNGAHRHRKRRPPAPPPCAAIACGRASGPRRAHAGWGLCPPPTPSHQPHPNVRVRVGRPSPGEQMRHSNTPHPDRAVESRIAPRHGCRRHYPGMGQAPHAVDQRAATLQPVHSNSSHTRRL